MSNTLKEEIKVENLNNSNIICLMSTLGKTSTAYLLKEIIEKAGLKVGLISQTGIKIGNETLTKVENIIDNKENLNKIIEKMNAEKCDYIIAEYFTKEIKDLDFKIAFFNNIYETDTNIDEKIEDYREILKKAQTAIANVDTIYTGKIISPLLKEGKEILTIGIDNNCKMLAKDITITNNYVDFKVRIGDKNERIKSAVPGRFSIYNALGAVAISNTLNINTEVIVETVQTATINGRSQILANDKELTIMLDCANSINAITSVVESVKKYTKGNIIMQVDCEYLVSQDNKAEIGAELARLADTLIISNIGTDKDIEEGIKTTKTKYKIIEDNNEAIKFALGRITKMDMAIIISDKNLNLEEAGKTKDYIYSIISNY